MNYFGKAFMVTTFGESHGEGVGCVIDGVPAGLEVNKEYIQTQLDRRKPGQNAYSTPRKEDDEVEILSGVFKGLSTGTPIALLIRNKNQKSKDYTNVKDLFRPGHGDFTYFKKYGLRDYRGGGRSSARESAARVAAGAVAKKMLEEFGLHVRSGVSGIGERKAINLDFSHPLKSEIFALDKSLENEWKEMIKSAKKSHDSIGGEATIEAVGIPVGLGEPLYDKLDGLLGGALMGLNGVKAVEIGEGVNASTLRGSQNNDQMDEKSFLSNHSGGVLGGISTGESLHVKVHFKPTPSIFIEQQTRDIDGKSLTCKLKGRHDPCIAVRGSVVAEMIVNLILADLLLLNVNSSLKGVKEFYEKR